VLAVQTVSGGALQPFRMSATATANEWLDQSFTVVTKLKLCGTPTNAYENTAFVTNMFSSNLKVASMKALAFEPCLGLADR
jgi:hypothetical protein